MTVLPADWIGLILIVYILGLKHGMDPDHLATIDGLTRFNATVKPRLSRWSGFFFSLGHGIVVTLVAVFVTLFYNDWDAPLWLQDFGAWISVVFLYLLGFANLIAVAKSRPEEIVRSVGLKSRLLGKLIETSHPVLIAFIGALFALSFDTVSQAALFSLTAASIAGWAFPMALGVIFMLGMMTTDGVNGWWVARLISRADQRAAVASRVMGLAVAGLSILVGTVGLARQLSPSVAAHTEGRELIFGIAVVAIVIFSFLLGKRLARVEGRISP